MLVYLILALLLGFAMRGDQGVSIATPRVVYVQPAEQFPAAPHAAIEAQVESEQELKVSSDASIEASSDGTALWTPWLLRGLQPVRGPTAELASVRVAFVRCLSRVILYRTFLI